MQVLILSRGPSLYSTRRLASVARRRGHSVEILDALEMTLAFTDGEPRLYLDDELVEADAVIPRIGASTTFDGLAVLRQLEMSGAALVNSPDAIATSRDKLRCMQAMAGHGIPIPDTAFLGRRSDAAGVGEIADGPLVIKLLEGTQGKGVMLADSTAAAVSIVEAFQQLNERILVQEFIAESAGRDIRAFVVGKQVVAVMERRAPAGEFRSNLHQGGSARRVTLTRALERIALRATRALGLDVAGVDLLLSQNGPLVIEVNPCPGLEGIESTTGVNVAGYVIDHMETLVDPKVLTTQQRRRLRSAC